MNKAFNHYKEFLADVYSWSLGDKAALFAKNKDWLLSQNITKGSLLDLGAGFGSHAIPAFELGLNVTAVDFSVELLAELIETNPDLHAVEGDLINFLETSEQSYDHIICLGDTLTHLESFQDVVKILGLMKSRGTNIFLSWRDYKTIALNDANSTIVVKEDEQQRMLCVLENLNEEKIKVTDSIGNKVHSYEKLKITPADVSVILSGFDIETRVQNRLVQMSLKKGNL